jgi:two-component system, chemotaxis family, protein-glutamate methylesterase/glutaminase
LIKVLVVDDSALMRRILTDILNSDSDIKVIDTGINGKFAVEKARNLMPDVITMDIMMPEMDGITAIKEILKEVSIPIIIVSAYTKKDSEHTLKGIEAGAVDFVEKPSGEISVDMDKVKEELITKVKSAAAANVHHFKAVKPEKIVFKPTKKKIIVIGSSTGGPKTVEILLAGLPKNIPVPILIAQHMPAEFTKAFADRLNTLCEIEVREAKDGDSIEEGVALIAPGGFDMVIQGNAEDPIKSKIRIIKKKGGIGAKPNINMLFMSAAELFKENTIGIVLTGMGNDGTEGCRKIKEFEGTTVAESKESSIIYGMPKSVADANLADEILPIEKMAVALMQLLEV